MLSIPFSTDPVMLETLVSVKVENEQKVSLFKGYYLISLMFKTDILFTIGKEIVLVLQLDHSFIELLRSR